MKKFFSQSGVLFERVKWSRIPLVVAALAVVPTLAFARGPIVSGSVDWTAVVISLFLIVV